ERHPPRVLVGPEPAEHRLRGDPARLLPGVAEGPGGDAREGDRPEVVLGGKPERLLVAGAEQLGLPLLPGLVDLPDRADHMPREEAVAPREPRRPRGTAPQPAASPSSPGPAARWMAPSTPPPPSSDSFAALTRASTSSWVMSPSTTRTRSARVTAIPTSVPCLEIPGTVYAGRGSRTRAGRPSQAAATPARTVRHASHPSSPCSRREP